MANLPLPCIPLAWIMQVQRTVSLSLTRLNTLDEFSGVPHRAYISTRELARDPSKIKPCLIKNPCTSFPLFKAERLAAAEIMLTSVTVSGSTPLSFIEQNSFIASFPSPAST
uniref:Uncharacterized protein n=1 Tax=Opuntia streptacantha TaxID=393608 RepID=A0A7C9EG67_OPUST